MDCSDCCISGRVGMMINYSCQLSQGKAASRLDASQSIRTLLSSFSTSGIGRRAEPKVSKMKALERDA